MKRFSQALMVSAVALGCGYAQAQDDVAVLLAQPSSSVPISRISRPVEGDVVQVPYARQEKKPIVEQPAADPANVPAPVGSSKTAPVTEMVPTPLMSDVPTPVAKPVIADQSVLPQASMLEVLAKSYASSPTLKAERENLRIQYEEVAQADALRRPKIDADGGVAAVYSETDPGSDDSFVSKDIGVVLVQPVWAGGRFVSYIDQQMRLSEAGIAAYEGVTQQVFLNVITAAMDIVRDRATITLTEKTRELIAEQLSAAENGFEVGALTRTDVAQAKARLSEAEAALTGAQAAYESSLARYRQYAGMDARDVDFAHDTGAVKLPADLAAAQALGETDNPEIVYARHLESAADKAVDVAVGQLYPLVTMVGTADRDWEPLADVDDSQSATLGLRATMNLYEGGAMQSRVRQAKISRFEKQDRVEEAQRSVAQQVATAWNNHQAARARITALESQVEAATIARNGVYKEREVGQRTVLDTLDAERELLNAEVGLVQARRDAVVADYSLLAATGQLTPSRIGVMAQADEQAVIKSTRGHMIGTGVAPRD